MVLSIYVAMSTTIYFIGKNNLTPKIFRPENSDIYILQASILVYPNLILTISVVLLLSVLWKYHYEAFYSVSPAIIYFFIFETTGLIL